MYALLWLFIWVGQGSIQQENQWKKKIKKKFIFFLQSNDSLSRDKGGNKRVAVNTSEFFDSLSLEGRSGRLDCPLSLFALAEKPNKEIFTHFCCPTESSGCSTLLCVF